ncbi:MAG: metal-dependent transcriptional regulator [Nanoarchaeota archaeon]|nr:metal-dependent transcriptional regulator [Nanoarchaeota archaeon]
MEQKSTEDYLRAMFYLYEKEGDEVKGLRSVDVAKELNISKPSVSEMVRKFVERGFVKASPYSNIFFTKKGLKEARRVMHNHRVIEVFLKNILDYDTNKVHEEAHRLEHAFSEESIGRLDKFLNNPKVSPHGMKIPHEK